MDVEAEAWGGVTQDCLKQIAELLADNDRLIELLGPCKVQLPRPPLENPEPIERDDRYAWFKGSIDRELIRKIEEITDPILCNQLGLCEHRRKA